MNCSKCGGDTVMKSGISKKNGKPWTGFKCLDQACGNMDFQKGNFTPKPAPIQKQTPTNEPEIIKLLLDIRRRVDELNAKIEAIHPAYRVFKGTKAETIEKSVEEKEF